MGNNSKNSKTPHYAGHRERLRKRFNSSGVTALADYELLELILFRALPRRDVKPLAKKLLDTFGSFSEVISATPARLKEINGIGESVITEIKIVQATVIRYMQDQIINRNALNSWGELLKYCHASMAYETKEQFRILFLDKKIF